MKKNKPSIINGITFYPHPNGGGLVAKTAHVDKNVYIGLNAMVCDNAKVYGHAKVGRNTKVFGNEEVWRLSLMMI